MNFLDFVLDRDVLGLESAGEARSIRLLLPIVFSARLCRLHSLARNKGKSAVIKNERHDQPTYEAVWHH